MRALLRKSRKKRTSDEHIAKSRHLSDEHGTTYQEYIQRQLSDERERFSSLEDKANSLISGSGTLVTLILAIGALATDRTTDTLNAGMRASAICSLVLFVLAAIAGLSAIRTRKYSVPTADALDDMRKREDVWARAEPAARGIVIQFDISTIRTLREVNNDKAWWVARGRLMQVLAVAALTVAAVIVLSG